MLASLCLRTWFNSGSSPETNKPCCCSCLASNVWPWFCTRACRIFQNLGCTILLGVEDSCRPWRASARLLQALPKSLTRLSRTIGTSVAFWAAILSVMPGPRWVWLKPRRLHRTGTLPEHARTVYRESESMKKASACRCEAEMHLYGSKVAPWPFTRDRKGGKLTLIRALRVLTCSLTGSGRIRESYLRPYISSRGVALLD